MYIAPNTVIRILKNVPLDKSYRNTIYFASSGAQSGYFSGLTKYTLTENSYQRYEWKLRIDIEADSLYDCNYLMFQNSNFGNKWFYGFINSVEYKNNSVSEITFELDIMQTWFFDYTISPSFVEREHVGSDGFFENLVPENMELGEYVSHSFEGTGHLGRRAIVIAATFDQDLTPMAGGMYAGIYSGLFFNVFSNYSDANDFIERATVANDADGIISCFMMPEDFVSDIGGSAQSYDIQYPQNRTNIDGYVPKNKKLFSYPYNFMFVSNLDGNYAEFKYEYFRSSTQCTFSLAGDMSCNPQVVLWPTNYKGLTSNYNEKIVMDGWPQCSFTTDTFKAWLAQNASSLSVSGVSSAYSAVSGGISGAAVGGTAGAVQGAMPGVLQIAGLVAKAADTYSLPRQAHGSAGSSASSALGLKDFAFIRMTVRAEFAKIIDDYWNMFGYPIHEVKTPNRNSRPHWNYVKTVASTLTGSVPADDMAKMRSIYDNGITFWKNGSEVGNYFLDNSI